MAVASGPRPQILRVRDASGGLNLRDAQVSLAPNETPDAWNVTMDERGGVSKRLGYEKQNPSPYGGGLVKNEFYWESGQALITQAGAKLYKDDSTTEFKTFTTAARCGFADFLIVGPANVLYFLHPIDGLFYYDGTTVTAVADVDAPKGDVLLAWQNKLFAAGNPATGAGPRLSWSALADGTAYAAADYIDLREKDSEDVLCLAGSSGVDVTGRQGMLAFKAESAYRIVDSGTGEYVTLDTAVGAASALSAVGVGGRTYVISQAGIFSTDGLTAMREESERLRPLFTPGRLNFAQFALFAAGTVNGRCYFSVPQAAATANDLAFELHPQQGWIVPRSDAMSCYATYGKNDEYLVGGSPSVTGQVYHLLTTGGDDTATIASRWQSRWFEPADGILDSLLRLRVLGRTEGSASLYIRKDYAVTGGDLRTLAISAVTPDYDSGVFYDSGEMYGPTTLQEYQDHFSLGTCKAVSFVIEETSALVGAGPQYLQQGTSPEVGAWAIYGWDLTHVPLGLA